MSRVRYLLRELRHAPDRLLHSRRRRNVVQRLSIAPPRSVGFVCYGNICRSPYATAAAIRAFQQAGLVPPDIWSAGFVGPDRPCPVRAQHVAFERGIDLAVHRSRLVDPSTPSFDWIFVMEPWQKRYFRRKWSCAAIALLGDLDPQPISQRAIPDPVDRPEDVFRACYERIDRCVATLVQAVGGRLAPRWSIPER